MRRGTGYIAAVSIIAVSGAAWLLSKTSVNVPGLR